MNVLFVAADAGEAACLPPGRVLVTGAGLVRAGVAVARALDGVDRVVNVGTAGALGPLAGVFEVTSVHQHDFDAATVARVTGAPCDPTVRLEVSGRLPTARLASGDTFVRDASLRARLAARADLVDMEGFAVAWAARAAGVPCTLLKQVSDDADEHSESRWRAAVPRGAAELAAAVDKLGLL